MSARLPTADIHHGDGYVSFVPNAEVAASFDHLVGARAKLEASQPTHGFTGNQQNASLLTVPRVRGMSD
jgi:hypothetical protein